MKPFRILFFTTLILGFCITTTSAHFHSDTEQAQPIISDWAQSEVQQATELGLVPKWDYPQPEDYNAPITRTQFRQIAMQFIAVENNCDESTLNELAGYYMGNKDENGNLIDPFTDGYLNDKYAYYLGVVNGRGNGIFDSDGYITREEAAAMLLRAYQVCDKTAETLTGTVRFPDLETVSTWARESVETIAAWDIMKGMETGNFAPNETYTVEQCILTFLRLHNKYTMEMGEEGTTLFNYDQCINMFAGITAATLESNNTGRIETRRVEGPTATFVRMDAGGVMMASSDFYFIYKNGGMKRVDLGLCSYPGSEQLGANVTVTNCKFSETGDVFTCMVILRDTVPPSGNIVYHEAGTYSVAIDVNTLRCSLNAEV